MAYTASGFKTITHIGSIDGAAGANRAIHAYVTVDDAATVETADYFLPIYARLKVGDQSMCLWTSMERQHCGFTWWPHPPAPASL